MATVTWVGRAQAVPQAERGAVGSPTPGTAYGFNANSCTVRYTAVTGNTAADVCAGIVSAAAAAAAAEPRLRELTVTVNATTPTSFDVVGASDGAPIESYSVTAGVTNSSIATPTGPHHADNVANYSGGALPSGTDTLAFTGLSLGAGPKYALNALSGITLALVDVLPDYAGGIGLPPFSAAGVPQFRTRFMTLKAAAHRIRSAGGDFEGRFCIRGGAVESDVTASGSGATAGVAAVHLHDFPTGSKLEAQGMGVVTAPEFGQACNFDAGVTATRGAYLDISARTDPGNVLFDGSSGVVDTAYDTLTIQGDSNVLAGPSASCSTGTGIGCTVKSGTLDWRSASVPASEVVIGTDATVRVTGAIAVMPAWEAHMYERATLDDSTGRIAMPQVVNYVQCAPQNVTVLRIENIKATFDTLA